MENLVSIIIPSRNEMYLNKTLRSLLDNAGGDIEIIVILDGPTEWEPLQDKRVKYIKHKIPEGMRPSINKAVKSAKGKYIMKCDAHCAFGKDYDLILKKDCKENWVVVPRRYGMNKRDWTKHDDYVYEFQYISHPEDEMFEFKGVDWPAYANRCRGKSICDLMTFQGSCWFMHKKHFTDTIGYYDTENFGTMGAEAQEVCLKTWLSGGECKLNRNTWYAHKKKVQSVKKRGYRKPMGQWRKSRAYLKKYFFNEAGTWKGKKDINWLVHKKFAPVPSWHFHPVSNKYNRKIMARWRLNTGPLERVSKLPWVIPDLDRKGLVELWKDLGYKVGAEIGVERGRFSEMMVKNIPGLKLYLVDQYYDYEGCRKKRGERHKRDEIEAKRRTKGYDVEFMRMKSEEAYMKIPDDSLDFVYIDGNHKYDYVMEDIIMWSRKIKKGGMMSGHDYYDSGRSRCRAKSAVDHYTQFHRIEPWYLTDKTTWQRTTNYNANKHASWFWIIGCGKER